MIKKISILLIFVLFIIQSVNAVDIATNVTANSIEYTFSPALNFNDSVYFDNEKIESVITDRLIVNNLNVNTDYALTILFDDNNTQSIVTKTRIYQEEFYYQYGFLGLIIIILIFIILSLKISIFAFISLMLSSGGLALCLKTDTDKISVIIFICLIGVSLVLMKSMNFGNKEIE